MCLGMCVVGVTEDVVYVCCFFHLKETLSKYRKENLTPGKERNSEKMAARQVKFDKPNRFFFQL